MCLVIGLAGIASPDALAQERTDPRQFRHDEPVSPVDERTVRPLDEAVEDVGPLGTSLRLLEDGLSVPGAFRNVYPVPGRPGWLMRIDGALYAVFPQSVYDALGPLVPNGTVFYIGEPEIPEAAGPTPLEPAVIANPSRINNRLRTRVAPATAQETSDAAPSGLGRSGATVRDESPAASLASVQSIVTDPSYRRQRLMELMRRAARSAGG